MTNEFKHSINNPTQSHLNSQLYPSNQIFKIKNITKSFKNNKQKKEDEK